MPDATAWRALDDDVVSRVYQFGARDSLVAPLRASIARATNVRLCSHSTAIALETNASGRRVTTVAVGTPGGARWSVRAKRIVLAAGAVENARLLLVVNEARGLMGDGTEWVGRGFLEHPRDRGITLRPHATALYSNSSFYDLHRAADGTWIIGRLAIGDAALASGELLNASATLFPRLSSNAERMRALLPAFAARWLPGTGHGWSARRSAAKDFDGFSVLLNVEQTPHPDNRITLSSRHDSLGVPFPSLHWQWRPDDHARLGRVRELIARSLADVGVASVDESSVPDPNAHHHAGTTRMHDDPKLGVTDRHGRVHSMENLYIAGASTFPTAGFANPVLTIVAMALRLSRHLVGAAANSQ